jgi:hypothetical protein
VQFVDRIGGPQRGPLDEMLIVPLTPAAQPSNEWRHHFIFWGGVWGQPGGAFRGADPPPTGLRTMTKPDASSSATKRLATTFDIVSAA